MKKVKTVIAAIFMVACSLLALAYYYSYPCFCIEDEEIIAKTFVEHSLEAPLKLYRIHNGSYPTTEQGLVSLLECPNGFADSWKGPYITMFPVDPWGEEYIYVYPGIENKDSYDLFSFGKDRESSDDDITNWN